MRRSQKTGTVIIGAGFAGLSTACHLIRRGIKNIVVLEKEARPVLHASGRNAGMVRQTVSDPALARLAHEGALALRAAAKKEKRLFTGAGGSLLLSSASRKSDLEAIQKATNREGVKTRRLSRREAAKRVPLLENAAFDEALYCPTDGLVDIDVLGRLFVRELLGGKVSVCYNQSIKAIEPKKAGFRVITARAEFEAERVVNAAGAWADEIGRLAGATEVPFKAYRRHLYVAEPFKPFSRDWPFVWDLSGELYFRPLRRSLLLSPCDKDSFELRSPAAAKAEKTDPAVEKVFFQKMDAFSPAFRGLRIRERKAALRTMTEDGRFVIGEDPAVKNFFWVAGLGGHGMTTSFAVGRLAADLILGKRTDAFIEKAFSPARF